MFTALLAKRLTAETAFNVQEGTPGGVLEPGQVWLAPGDFHMTVKRALSGVARVELNQDPQENSVRPAVDVLFRSLAKGFGAEALAVVLTGMGQDGLDGARAIREAGGYVLAQDRATSVVWGMPGAVVQAGVAHETVPLPEMARAIATCVSSSPLLLAGGRVVRAKNVS